MTVIKYETKDGPKYEYRTYIKRFGRSIQVHKRGFLTKDLAETAEAKLICSRGKDYSPNMTFKELYDQYHRAYVLKNKRQSIRRSESYFKNQILPFFQNAFVSKITEKDYMDWQEKILSKNYSDSYNKGLHTAMVSIFKYGQKNYYLDRNVAQEVGGFKKRHIRKKHDVWTYDEYKKFLSVVDNIKDKALFAFMFETGARFGEAAALTWNDYYGTYVDINKTIAKELDNNGKHIINIPKTIHSVRKIRLSTYVIELLNQLKEYYSMCIDFDNSWFIFGGLQPYSHTTATVHKNYYCKKANVKTITLHAFRHSHASILINNGIPITDISERLGHSNPAITLSIYSHMLEKEYDPIVEELNKLNS